MTPGVTIARARTRARLIGQRADAARVQDGLDRMLSGPVALRLTAILAANLAANLAGNLAGRLVGGLAGQSGDASITCIPALALRLRLTRAELESGTGADRWALAIAQAVAQASAGPQGAGVWRFADRRAYHAGYVLHRLGLLAAPGGVFAGFGSLDLLSPCRCMAEMLAADPGLWQVLAQDAVAAQALVRAVLHLGGAEAMGLVLGLHAVGPAPALGVPDMTATGFGRVLSQADAVLARVGAGVDPGWQNWPLAQQWLFVALLLGQAGADDPVLLAGVVLVLLAVVRRNGLVTGADVVPALIGVQAGVPDLARLAAGLAGCAAQGGQIAALVVSALPAVARLMPAVVDAPAAAAPVAEPGPATPGDAKSKPSQTGGCSNSVHFSSGFAGVALVLPLLAEDRIGVAFSARIRLAALALLVRSDRFAAPQDSDFLAALCGTDSLTNSPPDRRQGLPDRPHQRDMLFIPAQRHAAIRQAEPGAARLAAWLLARFAATLPGLAASSHGFVQRQFFHIPGEVWIDPDQVTLRLDPVPLQAVLDLGGRIGADLARLEWLGGQRMSILCSGAAQ